MPRIVRFSEKFKSFNDSNSSQATKTIADLITELINKNNEFIIIFDRLNLVITKDLF